MIRRWRYEFDLVENIQGESDGMGGFRPGDFKVVDNFMGLALDGNEELNVRDLGVMSVNSFDIITPTKLPVDWLNRRLEIHYAKVRLRITRYRNLKRLSQITVEVIDNV